MSKTMTISEAAAKWNISGSLVSRMCREGKIPQVQKTEGKWLIPADAKKPVRVNVGRSVTTGIKKKQREMLPLPIGVSDYRKASSSYYYVDKTLMIRDFLDEVPMVSLFTRPRRFGKTLNMDMLRTFFEKAEEDTSVYFRDKKIWKCGAAYKAEQGKYPVVFISFKDVKCSTWPETYDMLAKQIVLEYKRHPELMDVKHNADADFYCRIIQSKATENDLMVSLMMLTKMLHDYHGIEPIVIIDEYDTPIQQGHSSGFYDEAILFIRNLFSGAFKDNSHLKWGFLTGILRVGKESIFSGLNNLKIYSILDNKFSEYFGFTPAEVREMAEYYAVPEKYEEICEWYDGYRFGKAEIFNPWSVINYFSNDCLPRAFWLSTGSNDIIGEMLTVADNDVYEHLHELMLGKSFLSSIDTSVIYPQIRQNPSSIYSFLLVAGYLKAEEIGISPSGDLMCNVSLPNKEVALVYNKEILAKLDQIVPQSLAVSIQEAVYTHNSAKLKFLLEKLLRESVSFYDTAKETFYHGLILGLCATFGGDYYVTSNRESGDGRYDIQIMPKNTEQTGFLFELKATKSCSEQELHELAETALQQINENRYEMEMRNRGITWIVKYGVAFSGKMADVVVEG